MVLINIYPGPLNEIHFKVKNLNTATAGYKDWKIIFYLYFIY